VSNPHFYSNLRLSLCGDPTSLPFTLKDQVPQFVLTTHAVQYRSSTVTLWIFGGLNLTPVHPNPMFHCKRDMSNCLQILKDVPQLKLSSIGLKSREYGGKKRRTQPKPSTTSRSAHVLWIAQLSRINMLLSWG